MPNNVHAGDKIHVQAPDGRLNEIVVPQGFGPGATFTVEFADAPPPKKEESFPYTAPVAEATAEPISYNHQNNSNYDDGFATGFHNPNFVPTAPARPHGGEGEIDLSSYPTATNAKPVY